MRAIFLNERIGEHGLLPVLTLASDYYVRPIEKSEVLTPAAYCIENTPYSAFYAVASTMVWSVQFALP